MTRQISRTLIVLFVGLALILTGVATKGEPHADFQQQVEQPYELQGHLLLLWEARRACHKDQLQAFNNDAQLLAKLTGTQIEVQIRQDGSANVRVSKDLGHGKVVTVQDGHVAQATPYGQVGAICGYLS